MQVIREFYSVKEIAVYLGVGLATVYRWIDKGKLPAIKVGGTVKVPKEDFTTFMQSARKAG